MLARYNAFEMMFAAFVTGEVRLGHGVKAPRVVERELPKFTTWTMAFIGRSRA